VRLRRKAACADNILTLFCLRAFVCAGETGKAVHLFPLPKRTETDFGKIASRAYSMLLEIGYTDPREYHGDEARNQWVTAVASGLRAEMGYDEAAQLIPRRRRRQPRFSELARRGVGRSSWNPSRQNSGSASLLLFSRSFTGAGFLLA
jgi:hypothetical protein